MSATRWTPTIRIGEISGLRPGARLERRLAPDESVRGEVAELLDIEALDSLEGTLLLSPWFDGVQIEGRWRARITQICGVSLDAFSTDLEGRFIVHAVPEGSDLAPQPSEREIVVDPEADDPPDVLESDVVDLGDYLIEHLALEIDPFPRKPGVEFVPPEPTRESSPFDVLLSLKDKKSND